MSGPGYSEGFTYDGIGRLQTRTISSDATYVIEYAYNTPGALDTLTYPTRTSGYRLKLQYDYQNDQLLRVKDFNAPGIAFWTANDTDVRGNVVAETLGNGTSAAASVSSWGGGPTTASTYGMPSLGELWNEMADLLQPLVELPKHEPATCAE